MSWFHLRLNLYGERAEDALRSLDFSPFPESTGPTPGNIKRYFSHDAIAFVYLSHAEILSQHGSVIDGMRERLGITPYPTRLDS